MRTRRAVGIVAWGASALVSLAFACGSDDVGDGNGIANAADAGGERSSATTPGERSDASAADGGDARAADASERPQPLPVQNTCASPMPPEARDVTLAVNVPSDFDPTAAPTATTNVTFTVLLPQRCPGDALPLVLHSHGYGGSRIKALAADGTLHPELPHFGSIDALAAALPYHGYVVISFDERGHGDNVPANGGGNARIIDPLAETQDARAILDYAFDHAGELAILTEPQSGIAKDVRVGTLGYSYGGGFQFPLALLDARIDTIVPNGTWHHLLYSLLPGDAVKLSFDGLLCLLATTGGVSNTPMVQTLCNVVGPLGATANLQRSRADLMASISGPAATPRAVSEQEITTFLDRHGAGYFQRAQKAGTPWGFGEANATLRPVPALLLQGNRDVLFNATEAVWNARYFGQAGGDVRMLTTEGGHMNPLVGQTEGTAACGKTEGVDAIRAWLDKWLRAAPSAVFDAIPRVCLSVAATQGTPNVAPAGLRLERMPVGAQSGPGTVTAKLSQLSASVSLAAVAPTFVPVTTIAGAGKILAGVPTIRSLTVTPGFGALLSTNAFVGVGIQRGGTRFLVDDQVTAFTAGTHTNNRSVAADSAVWLPAVGEKLQDGDVVGLLFYPQHIQYAAVVSAPGASGAPGVINYVGGTQVPPVTSALGPLLGVTYTNPYSVTAQDVELPIVIAGAFPGSALSE